MIYYFTTRTWGDSPERHIYKQYLTLKNALKYEIDARRPSGIMKLDLEQAEPAIMTDQEEYEYCERQMSRFAERADRVLKRLRGA